MDPIALKKAIDFVGATPEDPLRLCFLVDPSAFPAWLTKRTFAVIPHEHHAVVKLYAVRIAESIHSDTMMALKEADSIGPRTGCSPVPVV
jgi:hypothetical protein